MKKFLLLMFCAVTLLTGCGVKLTKSMMKAILKASMKIPENTVAQDYDGKIDVPYVDDASPAQMLDIFYAPEDVRKDAVLVDFHGGFYVAGQKEGNRAFASAFLKEGFDVVLVSYRLNDGKLDVSDELADCEAAGRPLTFVDIESDDKKVAHVHNVTSIDLPESKQVNAAMVDFMINCL